MTTKSIFVKLFKVFLVLVALFILLLATLFYYFFQYPRSVAEGALDSVAIGQQIEEVLHPDSKFVKNLKKRGIGPSMPIISSIKSSSGLSQNGDRPVSEQECNSIDMSKPFTFGEVKANLQKCNILSTVFMPAFLYRCSVYIQYDENLRVVKKSNAICWD